MPHQITLSDIQVLKKNHEPISVMTAYDYPFAKLLDESGIDMILVGDSLANVVLGLDSTKDVKIADMVYHAKAVCRAVQRACVVGDMPFDSYQLSASDPVRDARALMEAGCDAVKVEWFSGCIEVVKKLRAAEIPVTGHIGLTPQTVDQLGGFKVQGRTADAAGRLFDQAGSLESAGCFALVLECVPDRVAKVITERLNIPTIGIGAGADCDGQVLVLHDALGILRDHQPKFVKPFCDVAAEVRDGMGRYIREVKDRSFPDEGRRYGINDQEFEIFLRGMKNRDGGSDGGQ